MQNFIGVLLGLLVKAGTSTYFMSTVIASERSCSSVKLLDGGSTEACCAENSAFDFSDLCVGVKCKNIP